jgi:8-oxo-dGTP pyrophosphatase MutT (NUDIX family)
MAPVPRPGWQPAEFPADAREAAALLLLYPVGRATRLVLTLRATHMPNHGGQISLPGGTVKLGATFEMTALSEVAEKIGVAINGVTLLGRLTPLHIPVSTFVLFPVMAFAAFRPTFQPNASEVARVLDVH